MQPLIITIDRQGTIANVEESAAKRVGYVARQLKGKFIGGIMPNVSANFLQQQVRSLVHVPLVTWNGRLVNQNGRLLETRVESRFHPQDTGHLEWKLFFAEQSEIQTRLYEMVAEKSYTAAWQWNLMEGSFTVTANFYSMLGIDHEQIPLAKRNIITVLQQVVPHKQLQRLTDLIRKLRLEPGNRHISLQLPQDHKYRNLNIWLRPIVQEKIVSKVEGTVSFEQSGSGRVGPEDGQIGANEIAFQIIEGNAAACFWLNEDNELIYRNKMSTELYRMPTEMPFHVSEIDVEHSVQQWKQVQRGLVNNPMPKPLVTTFITGKGKPVPVELHLTYHRVKGQQPIVSVAVVDISLRRQQQISLSDSKLQIQSLNRRLEKETKARRLEQAEGTGGRAIISRSALYDETLELVKQVAETSSTVLITGETGTGKELLAHAIHEQSRRSARPMVRVNCAVLPENLIESELFGHERGAFTGATQQKPGRFELADNGTLFLDEIGEVSLTVQSKLLRVLQEGEFERVGGNRTLYSDVRVIAATNRDLQKMVQEGTFRSDLYYRLSVFPIHNPPLRARPEDVAPLTRHFIEKYSKKMGREVSGFRSDDMKRLESYYFPGNVRELEHIIERAIILSRDGRLRLPDLTRPGKSPTFGKIKSLEEMQRDYIEETLRLTGGRVSGPGGAAELLDIHPQTLHSRMRKLGIRREEFSR